MEQLVSGPILPSGDSLSDSDLCENDSTTTFNMILRRAEEVQKQCLSKGVEWTQHLECAQSEMHRTIHEEFTKTIAFMQIWEDQFNKEIREVFAKRRRVVEKECSEIRSLMVALNKSVFTTTGYMRASSVAKDIQYKEVSNLLGITGKMLQKVHSMEVLPPISFKRSDNSCLEEGRHRFGYLATLDVLPCQLTLQHPIDVICGPMVFVVQVPQTRFLAALAESLDCTVAVTNEEIRELKPLQHGDNLELTLEIASKKCHIIKVELYHQHINGSPFVFKPSSSNNPSLNLQEVTDTAALQEANDDLEFLSPSSSSDSYIPETKPQTMQKVSAAGLNMVKQAIMQAQNENARLEKKNLEQVQKMHFHQTLKTSQKKLLIPENFIVDQGIDTNNNSADVKVKVEPITDGNVADDEEERSDNRFPEEKDALVSLLGLAQTAPKASDIKQEVTSSNLLEPKLEPNVDVDQRDFDDENEIADDDDKRKKVARKSFRLVKPLRRPRIPVLLANMSGTYTCNDATPEVKTEEVATDLVLGNDCCPVEYKSLLIKEEKESSPSELTLNSHAPLTVANGKFKTANNDKAGVCTSREDSLKDVKSEENFGYVMSTIEKHDILPATTKINDKKSQDKERQKTAVGVAQSGILKAARPTLSAKMIYKSYGPTSDPLSRPIGVAELSDGSAAVADTFNDRVALFNEDGKFVKYFRTQNMNRPSAIAVLPDGRFAVKDSQSITIFTPKGEFDNTITTGLRKPFGLTINSDGQLVTVQATMHGYMLLLTINPESGEIIKQMKVQLYSMADEKRLLSKPRFISYHREGRVLVVDLGLNCIYVVDGTTGTLLAVFGESGGKAGQFSDPSGITCDSDGYILIGDSRNHRVQVFDPEGRFVCILGTDTKLSRPSGIWLTPKGQLYILNYWDNSLVKYSIIN